MTDKSHIVEFNKRAKGAHHGVKRLVRKRIATEEEMTELNRQILAKEQQIRDLNQRLADASDLYKVLLRHSKQTQDTKKRIKNIEARITELQDRLNRLVDEEFVLLGQLGTVEIFLLQQKTVAERIRKCMN